MDAKEERLVARVRHHNPVLTVTELHIGSVDRSKKNLVIEYLDALKLNPSVESSPGLETVVSVDISSNTEQDDIFKNLLTYVRNIGVADVSITSEPFDERQPEIESTGSIPALESSSKDYTPLNSGDLDELISRDKSESEFELILSRPRRSESHESRRLHSDQSSKDVIGSILRVSEEGRLQSSTSLVHHSTRAYDRTKNPKHNPRHRIQKFWTRTKKLFKRKSISHQLSFGKLQPIVSNDSIQAEIRASEEKSKLKDRANLMKINAVTKTNQVNLNVLQKKLEKVSRDVFSMKNKCPGMKCDGPSLDAYTQTTTKTLEEVDLIKTKAPSVCKKCSNTSVGRNHIKMNGQARSSTKSISAISEISGSTESEHQVIGGGQVAPRGLRGMVTNLIPLYPNVPANFKRPIICELKPVGGPFFFRRMNSKKSCSYSTGTASYATNSTTNSPKSTRSTLTVSSRSVPSINQEPSENSSASYENVIYTRSGNEYVSCGLISTNHVRSPFERERLKKTQTKKPALKAMEINTSQVFKLPKVTQTKPRKKKKREHPKAPAVGTQTFSCASSTSCSELVALKSCGTKMEKVERVDKENSCHLLTKQPTETKETNSDTLVFKCDTCQELLDKPVEKKRRPLGKQKTERSARKGLGWGQYPDGNYGFGQSYAPGKVLPVFSLSTNFSSGSPFTLPATMDKGGILPCSKLCNIFGGKKKALMEELHKQKLELMQMRMVLVAINEELLAECSDSSSEECGPSSDDTYRSSDRESRAPLKQGKKVTFSDPLVNERLVNYANRN